MQHILVTYERIHQTIESVLHEKETFHVLMNPFLSIFFSGTFFTGDIDKRSFEITENTTRPPIRREVSLGSYYSLICVSKCGWDINLSET